MKAIVDLEIHIGEKNCIDETGELCPFFTYANYECTRFDEDLKEEPYNGEPYTGGPLRCQTCLDTIKAVQP